MNIDIEEKMYLEWKEKKISREEDNKMPSFTSHEEARAYFKERFGHRFQLMDSKIIGNKKIYLYNLILNEDYYMSYVRDEKVRMQPDSNFLFLFSYQSIEIFEDGFVHIIH